MRRACAVLQAYCCVPECLAGVLASLDRMAGPGLLREASPSWVTARPRYHPSMPPVVETPPTSTTYLSKLHLRRGSGDRGQKHSFGLCFSRTKATVACSSQVHSRYTGRGEECPAPTPSPVAVRPLRYYPPAPSVIAPRRPTLRQSPFLFTFLCFRWLSTDEHTKRWHTGPPARRRAPQGPRRLPMHSLRPSPTQVGHDAARKHVQRRHGGAQAAVVRTGEAERGLLERKEERKVRRRSS